MKNISGTGSMEEESGPTVNGSLVVDILRLVSDKRPLDFQPSDVKSSHPAFDPSRFRPVPLLTRPALDPSCEARNFAAYQMEAQSRPAASFYGPGPRSSSLIAIPTYLPPCHYCHLNLPTTLLVTPARIGYHSTTALQRIEADKWRHDDRRGYKRPSTEVWYPSERYEDRPSRRHYSEHRDYSHFPIDSLAPQKRNGERGPSHHRTSDSRDSRSSRGNNSRVLSSGVVIRHQDIQVDQTPCPPINRPTALWSSGSLLSHTPSPRNLRERLEYPNERVSSGGTSAPNSHLRTHISPRPGSSLNSDRLQEVNIQYDVLDNHQHVSPMVHIGSSQQHRISATLRLSDADANDAGPSNVRANPSTSLTTKPAGKKRVTKAANKTATKRVTKNALPGVKIKNDTVTKSIIPPRKKQRVDHDYVPCLALLWKDTVDVKVLESLPNLIDTEVTFKGSPSFVSFVYGALL
ncbi:hypothetical protein HID58_046460 [Brassica napus]|uniref:Uncharacterized protein n=1 Tax=Brassica napus TaxID=3708 RepID=A0ABQ8AWM5_BRANA|nr:hypothetical protein HID58_046460 [Brassica napus]